MPNFEIYVSTRRVVSVGLFTRKQKTLPDRYVFGTVHAASDLHAVNGFWEGGGGVGVREYPSLLNEKGEPIAKSPLKRRMLNARQVPDAD